MQMICDTHIHKKSRVGPRVKYVINYLEVFTCSGAGHAV